MSEYREPKAATGTTEGTENTGKEEIQGDLAKNAESAKNTKSGLAPQARSCDSKRAHSRDR